jgi:hypothetical protein
MTAATAEALAKITGALVREGWGDEGSGGGEEELIVPEPRGVAAESWPIKRERRPFVAELLPEEPPTVHEASASYEDEDEEFLLPEDLDPVLRAQEERLIEEQLEMLRGFQQGAEARKASGPGE